MLYASPSLASVDWYTTLRQVYAQTHGGDTGIFPTDPKHTVEVALALGQSLRTPERATWFTHEHHGLLANAEVVLHIVTALEDVSVADETVVRPGGQHNLTVVVPLQTFAVVENQCPSADITTDTSWRVSSTCADRDAAYLVLFHAIHLLDHVADEVRLPHSPAWTRRVISKGLRGLYVRNKTTGSRIFTLPKLDSTTGQPTGSTVALDFGTSAVMQNLPGGTNCFPEVVAADSDAHAACHAATHDEAQLARVHAADVESTAVHCVGGAWPNRPCAKAYHTNAPYRTFLSLEATPKATYHAPTSTWSLANTASGADEHHVAYAQHGASSGMTIRTSSPCWPHPACATGPAAAVRSPGGVPAWVFVTLAVALAAVVFAVVIMVRHAPNRHPVAAGGAGDDYTAGAGLPASSSAARDASR